MPRSPALAINGTSRRGADAEGDSRRIKLTVYLSREATDHLERLRFKSLDRAGNKPTGSQVIEGLLRAALKKEKIPPYPVQRRS
jgi:hypothetical protein